MCVYYCQNFSFIKWNQVYDGNIKLLKLINFLMEITFNIN